MTVNIILASAPNCVIGKENSLPWKIPEEIAYFKTLTSNSTIVMGLNTWESLGCKPLRNRINVVITHIDVEGADKTINTVQEIRDLDGPIWIIGGAKLIHSIFIGGQLNIDNFYISRIDKSYPGDVSFHNVYNFRLVEYAQMNGFQTLLYRPCIKSTNEIGYLNLLEKILKTGVQQNDRTGVGTLSLFGEQLKFDLKEGFPLLTTKQMAWRAIQEELFFFLAGKTDTKELEAKKVSIWRAHTSSEFLSKRGLPYKEGDMGPMYGYQWRNFDDIGLDQLNRMIEELRRDPYSRRLLMTTYNPKQADLGVLYPCHGLVVQLFCREDSDGKFLLSMLMYQRSADAFLGLPFNIASYSALLHLIARHAGMKVDTLTISLGNVHIYKNHISQVSEQLTRAPLVAPKLEVTKDILDWNTLDISYLKLWGYFYYPQIKADITV